jgi:RNA methyltransferase, TrmH family
VSIITSPQNPKVKYVASLRERRKRKESGVTLVEGYDELTLALASGIKPAEVFYCPALFRNTDQMRLVERIRAMGASLIEVDERVFARIAYRENPDGWLATFPLPGRNLSELSLSANPLIVVCESVEKPGNLGAILRTADAAGVDAVIACDPLTDWGNPNVVRASKGALFSVQVAAASSAGTLEWLREHQIRIVVATPQATTSYTRVDLRGPVAITVGEEKHGLSKEWLEQADESVVIPMFGRVNSLNVATATGLLIYEAIRQRS